MSESGKYPAAVTAGDVTVRTGGGSSLEPGADGLAGPIGDALSGLVGDGVPAALTGKDATLWGAGASAEASIRLGWLDAPDGSRELLARLAKLRAEVLADGLDHVVLAGMGGSSLAPEVISRNYRTGLTVLDTTDPQQVARAVADRLERTVVVVSSKSGSTIETDCHRRIYEAAFRNAGLSTAEAARRFVVVTDPGSPLERLAGAAGYRDVVLADPDVGGRYSALTAFGLVPAALTGVDVAGLLDQAAAVRPALARDEGNPGLWLGAALGAAGQAGHDKVLLAGGADGVVGFGDWTEQLLAESTGKEGRGLLPVVLEGPDAPGFASSADGYRVLVGATGPSIDADAGVAGPLGGLFLAWEYATAVAGRLLGINPFDQPNVQESKDNTQRVLDEAGDGPLPEEKPLFNDEAIDVHADPGWLGGADDVTGALRALLGEVPESGYLAVMAYLDRLGDAAAGGLRASLARRTSRPVTFGWGPRFLHSTGQFHKGGPPVGVFLQVTGAHVDDVAVPDRPYTLGRLQHAQALGDLLALRKRDRPVLRLHLRDRPTGLRQLLAAADALG